MGLKRGESHLAAQLAPLGINPFGKDAGQILEEIADAAKAQLSMGRSRESVLDYLTNVIGIDQATAEKLMEGREAFLAEQERLRGKVGTGDKHTEELKELNRALNELDAAWQNAKANIIGYVAPILTAIISSFTDLVHLFGENEWAGVIAGITAALAGFFGTIKSASWILGLLGIKTAATTATGTAIGGLGTAMGGVVKAIALPALLIGIIYDTFSDVYKAIKGGEMDGIVNSIISALFKPLFEGIGDLLWNLKEKSKSAGEKTGEWLKEKWEGAKEWYYNKRAEFGSAKSFYDFGNEAASENAAEKTKGLLYRPDSGFFVAYSDEPLISDENYEKPILPPNTTKVEVHMENSTYYGVSSENAETFGNEVGSGLTGAVQAGVSG